jgi:hypothetical protein
MKYQKLANPLGVTYTLEIRSGKGKRGWAMRALNSALRCLLFRWPDFGFFRPSRPAQDFNKPMAPFPGAASVSPPDVARSLAPLSSSERSEADKIDLNRNLNPLVPKII